MPFFLSCFRRCAWFGLAVVVLALSGCSSTRPPEGITPVTPFDLARYEGRWYELARLDHSFERGMMDVSAAFCCLARRVAPPRPRLRRCKSSPGHQPGCGLRLAATAFAGQRAP